MSMAAAVATPARETRRDQLVWAVIAAVVAAVVGAMEPRTAFSVAVAVAVAGLSFWRPSLGVAIVAATVPLQDAWPPLFRDVAFTWTKLTLVCLLGSWLARLALGRERLRMTPVAWAMIAYCLALVLSIAGARDIGAWAGEVYRWLVATAVYVIAASSVRTPRDRRLTLGALSIGIAFTFALALYQVVTASGPESFAQRGLMRAYALFGEPNPFAGYLEMATLPLLACGLLALRRPRRDPEWWTGRLAMLSAAAGMLAIGLTQSRGGGLGFLAGVAVIVWFAWPRVGRVLVIGAASVALILIWTPSGSGARAVFGIDASIGRESRQVTPATFATEERLAHWGAASRMWLKEPVFGIGAGNFGERFREFTPNWRFRISRGHAHSAYLQAASQAGSLGLASYLVLIGAIWARCRRRLTRAATVETRASSLGALAVLSAFAVHGLFEYLHVLSLGIALSAILALPEGERASRMDEPTHHGGN